MKQQAFEQRYADCWQQLDQVLKQAEAHSVFRLRARQLDPDLPQLYRRVCHHLSLAKERRYSHYLVDQLNLLVLRAHQQLYQRQTFFGRQLIRFVVLTFARRVRENAVYVWLASAVFYGPALITYVLIQLQPELIYSFMDHAQLADFERMYEPSAEHFGRDRQAEGDLAMFGHYIQNNISIGFQTFATGLACGVGSLFYLIFNGLHFGVVASHISNIGYHDSFYPFVIGHGSFELTAIVLAGAGGLMLGHSILAPGQLSRLDSLKQTAKKALDLLYGITLMLLIAAFLEAFWSSNAALPNGVKYTVGTLLWALVIGYLCFAGRAREAK